MRNVVLSVTMICALAAASVARAHDDLVPYVFNGKLLTGGHDDGTGENTLVKQVFGFDFQEEPSDPYFIGDPGFNNGGFAIGVFPNDGLLPTGSILRFAVDTNLLYWDGTGAVNFTAAPLGVDLGLSRGSFVTYISGAGQTGTAPTIGSTGASGRLHVHLGSELRMNGSSDPSSPNAPDGIYLLGLTLSLDGLGSSDPLLFVYNNGLSEELHDLAIDWAETSLVPEPQAWLLMGSALATAALVGRRRVRRAAR